MFTPKKFLRFVIVVVRQWVGWCGDSVTMVDFWIVEENQWGCRRRFLRFDGGFGGYIEGFMAVHQFFVGYGLLLAGCALVGVGGAIIYCAWKLGV